MELDTGAAVSILPLRVYKEKFRHIPLKETAAKLKTYTRERVQQQGQLSVKVEKDTVVEHLTFIVTDGPGPLLLGRDWLSKIPIKWNTIKLIGTEQQNKDTELPVGSIAFEVHENSEPKAGSSKGNEGKSSTARGNNTSVRKGKTSTL